MVLPWSSSWLQLANKTAVVTGAGSGIGAAVAKSLLEQGCHVVMADRDEERMHRIILDLQQQQQQQQQAGGGTGMGVGTSSIVKCDVSQEDDVQRLFQSVNLNSSAAQQQQHPATILVNCAGITRDGWIGRMSLDQWQQVQNVNLTGTFMTCREFLNQPKLLALQGMGDMKKSNPETMRSNPATYIGAASIINISSVVATQGNMGQVNYAASKGGVYSLTKALAKEVAHRSVRVNCVLPGFIDTEMTQKVPEPVRQQIQSKDCLSTKIWHDARCGQFGFIPGQL
jgi:NAD(P)-dependent dehydrogenase (short-subunit alcohol dehydrogenase family)